MVQNVNECLSKYLLNHITFCYQTWYNDAASWARVSSRKKIVCCLQGQGHNKGSFDQNVTLSTMSSELLILQQPNLVWWYMIISQNVLLKSGITLFKVKVTTKVQNVSDCLSKRYFLNHRKFCYQIWYGDAASWTRVSCRKKVFVVVAIFKVKDTARANMMKLWLFLLYYLNCWFLGNQAWSVDISSEARVPCEKKWITAFRVKATAKGQNLTFVQISSKPSIILFSNLV